MNKLLLTSIWGVLLSGFAFISYLGFLTFYPVKTLDISQAVVVTKEINPGGLFLYEVSYCKYTDAPAIVYRTFHRTDESSIETFPAVQTVTVPGCNTTRIPLQTAITTPPGEYYLLVDAVFRVNPIREEHVIFKSDNFHVR